MPENNPSSSLSPDWGRNLIEELARESLKERRARRRWRIFFLLLFFGLVAFSMVQCSGGGVGSSSAGKAESYVAQIDINGELADHPEAVSAEKVNAAMRRAFADPKTLAVILRINSPGGSPVQAGIIVDEMRRLRRNNPEKALYAVVEEMGLSGGYYIAAAADRIYVDKASMVGSIGVTTRNLFGVEELMKKLGIEDRTITAGKNKAFLSPFEPLSPEHKAHLQAVLDEIHQQFIEVVKEGRGQRLKETPDMFSGLLWSGERSIELGLVDGLGTVRSVARDVVDTEEVVDFTEYSPFELWMRQVGAAVSAGVWGHLQAQGDRPALR